MLGDVIRVLQEEDRVVARDGLHELLAPDPPNPPPNMRMSMSQSKRRMSSAFEISAQQISLESDGRSPCRYRARKALNRGGEVAGYSVEARGSARYGRPHSYGGPHSVCNEWCGPSRFDIYRSFGQRFGKPSEARIHEWSSLQNT